MTSTTKEEVNTTAALGNGLGNGEVGESSTTPIATMMVQNAGEGSSNNNASEGINNSNNSGGGFYMQVTSRFYPDQNVYIHNFYDPTEWGGYELDHFKSNTRKKEDLHEICKGIHEMRCHDLEIDVDP